MQKIHLIRDKRSRFDIKNSADFIGPARDLWEEIMDEAYGPENEVFGADNRPDIVHHIYTPIPFTSLPRWEPEDIVIYSGLCGLQPHELNNQRGFFSKTKVMRTYSLQDACDFRSLEGDGDEEDREEGGYFKDTAPTKWSNLRFWVKADIKKALAQPKVQGFAGVERVHASNLEDLLQYEYQWLYLDIETRDNLAICFSVYMPCMPRVWSYLAVDYNDKVQWDAPRAFAVLGLLMQKHRTVVHNAAYDLPFLALYHGLPFGEKIYCTMTAHHRCYPEADKSLAHCISLYTNFENHKVSSINRTHNQQQDQQLLIYNSRDVQVMPSIVEKQTMMAQQNLGLMKSLQEAAAIQPLYLTQMLRGLKIDEHAIFCQRKEGERRLIQLQRVADCILGPLKFDLNSSHQCVDYFHNKLNYPAVARTEKGAPSLKGEALYSLALAHNNPMIPLILAYRELSKEMSMLDITTP